MDVNGNGWEIKVGDLIKFTATTKSSCQTVQRTVNGFTPEGWYKDHKLVKPTVRYHGWPDFIVSYHEILEVEQCK